MPPVFVCPECSKKSSETTLDVVRFPTAGELAAHRYDEHGISPLDTIREARAKTTEPPSPKPERKPPMPCGICHGTVGPPGHRRETCPKRAGAPAKVKPSGCGYCHQTDGSHSRGCHRAGPKGTRGKRAAPARARRISASVPGPYEVVSKDLQARIIASETETQRLRDALAIVTALEKENGHGQA